MLPRSGVEVGDLEVLKAAVVPATHDAADETPSKGGRIGARVAASGPALDRDHEAPAVRSSRHLAGPSASRLRHVLTFPTHPTAVPQLPRVRVPAPRRCVHPPGRTCREGRLPFVPLHVLLQAPGHLPLRLPHLPQLPLPLSPRELLGQFCLVLYPSLDARRQVGVRLDLDTLQPPSERDAWPKREVASHASRPHQGMRPVLPLPDALPVESAAQGEIRQPAGVGRAAGGVEHRFVRQGAPVFRVDVRAHAGPVQAAGHRAGGMQRHAVREEKSQLPAAHALEDLLRKPKRLPPGLGRHGARDPDGRAVAQQPDANAVGATQAGQLVGASTGDCVGGVEHEDVPPQALLERLLVPLYPTARNQDMQGASLAVPGEEPTKPGQPGPRVRVGVQQPRGERPVGGLERGDDGQGGSVSFEPCLLIHGAFGYPAAGSVQVSRLPIGAGGGGRAGNLTNLTFSIRINRTCSSSVMMPSQCMTPH